MEIKGREIINSNDYDSLYISADFILANKLKDKVNNKFSHIGAYFIDDNFMLLSDDEQVKMIIERYLEDTYIHGIFQSQSGLSVMADRRLIFGDRNYSNLERKVYEKYDEDRKKFLLSTLKNFNEFYFYGEIGLSSYGNIGGIETGIPKFNLAANYDELFDIVYSEEERNFFFDAVDMIAGDRKVELQVDNFVDYAGEMQIAGARITGGVHVMDLHYQLTDLAIEAVDLHNEKIKDGKKLQMKMEGF